MRIGGDSCLVDCFRFFFELELFFVYKDFLHLQCVKKI